MRQFTPRPGTRSASLILEKPFAGIEAFDAVIQELVLKNPPGCTSYWTARRHNPPVARVRERYTAKFVYEDGRRRQIGSSSEVYDSVDGYRDGIHAVMANIANAAAHRGRIRHLPQADHFSAILKCHDENDGMYFLSLARDRITVASFTSETILKNIRRWVERSPALAEVISPG